MKNDDMLFDVEAMTEELDRTLRHLENRDPVPSQINIGFSLPGMNSDTWLTDQLDDVLVMLVTKDSGASIRPFWGDDETPEGYTAVNLTDFILASAKDELIQAGLGQVIIHIALSAWQGIEPACDDAKSRLSALIADMLHDTHQNEKGSAQDQKAEYHGITNALMAGQTVPSRVQCLFGLDETADIRDWDEDTVMDILYAFQKDNGGKIFTTRWAQEGKRLTQEEGRQFFATVEKGYVVNLTDFIATCCRYEKAITGMAGMSLVMFIMFVFQDVMGDNMGNSIKHVLADLEKIHNAIKSSEG